MTILVTDAGTKGLSASWATSSSPLASTTSTIPEGARAATVSLTPATAGARSSSKIRASRRERIATPGQGKGRNLRASALRMLKRRIERLVPTLYFPYGEPPQPVSNSYGRSGEGLIVNGDGERSGGRPARNFGPCDRGQFRTQ